MPRTTGYALHDTAGIVPDRCGSTDRHLDRTGADEDSANIIFDVRDFAQVDGANHAHCIVVGRGNMT
jgi:hypothetical protein